MPVRLFLSKVCDSVCKTKALRPPLHASHGVDAAWIIDWRLKIQRAGGMRRKSRGRTGCSLELLGVHDPVFALSGSSECKETRARECPTLRPAPSLHLGQIKLCFVSLFSGPRVIRGLSGRSHALLLPQTPTLVYRLFSLTAELSSLRFQFEVSKGESPKPSRCTNWSL